MNVRSNAYAERFVRTAREACLDQVVLIGEHSLRRVISELMVHYHTERNHQGLGNNIIDPEFGVFRSVGEVKYEMLRRVQIEGHSVSRTTAAFGCSRPTFYQAQLACKKEGLAGLLPQKRGPHQGHKLSEEVLAFVEQIRTSEGPVPTPQLIQRIRQRFDLVVHRRSLERALARRKKNANGPAPTPMPLAAAQDVVANYESLRNQVLGAPTGGVASPGWCLLVAQGLAAWLRTVSVFKPPPLPSSNTASVLVRSGLHQDIANLILAMVSSHYQPSPR